MNRLSVGAAGLLLAVSLACLTTTVKADNTEYANANYSYTDIQALSESQKIFFIKTVRDILQGDNKAVEAGEEIAGDEDKSTVYYRVVFDNKLDDKLAWMVENDKNDLINVYVKIMFNIFRRYEKNFRERLIKNEQDTEKQLRLQAVENFLTGANKPTNGSYDIHLPNAKNMSRRIYDELATGKHDGDLNQHVHTKTWNHTQWDIVYKALPPTNKYAYTGLTPNNKKHLSKDLKIVDAAQYKKEKEESQLSIAHRALQAKIDALSHSTTSAGDYFNSHQEAIDELKEHFAGHEH